MLWFCYVPVTLKLVQTRNQCLKILKFYLSDECFSTFEPKVIIINFKICITSKPKFYPSPKVNTHTFSWQKQTTQEENTTPTQPEGTLMLIKPNIKMVRFTWRFLQKSHSQQYIWHSDVSDSFHFWLHSSVAVLKHLSWI